MYIIIAIKFKIKYYLQLKIFSFKALYLQIFSKIKNKEKLIV